jgi:hypothetical protein
VVTDTLRTRAEAAGHGERGSWVNGLAEWTEGDTAYLSISFTWRMPDAYQRAIWYRALGYRVKAGGPAVFMLPHFLEDVAELPPLFRDEKGILVRSEGVMPDAVGRHNPMATNASRGCPVGCSFCIVPFMQGKAFTLLPDFEPRPILCDNNLSALPAKYQDFIIAKYKASGVRLLDANSGFEPRTFDDEVLARWTPINKGPWRFAYDDAADREHVQRVTRMLRHIAPRRKQVYVMIGGEPFDACMDRIKETIAWGCEPYVQPFIKLTSLVYRPNVRFDWTVRRLRAVQRWVNGRYWKYTSFENYNSSIKTVAQSGPGLFEGATGRGDAD